MKNSGGIVDKEHKKKSREDLKSEQFYEKEGIEKRC